jgi:hypothetical protein
MADAVTHARTDRTQLQQIIAELPEGIIVVNSDQTIAWANAAALAMHGVKSLKDLGETVSDYRAGFELRYRDQQQLAPGEYPMDRIVAGETFTDVVVEVSRPNGKRHGIQRVRGLVATDPHERSNWLALIIDDETERFDAEVARSGGWSVKGSRARFVLARLRHHVSPLRLLLGQQLLKHASLHRINLSRQQDSEPLDIALNNEALVFGHAALPPIA